MSKSTARPTTGATTRSLVVASGADAAPLMLTRAATSKGRPAPKKKTPKPGKPVKPARRRKKPAKPSAPSKPKSPKSPGGKPKKPSPRRPARKVSRPKKRPAAKPKKKPVRKPARKAKPAKRSTKPAAKPSRPAKRKKVKGRLLWIGDAVVPTGFSTVTHALLEHLHDTWEVIVSGVNYEGQRHAHPYRILPARQGRHGDMWGLNAFPAVCAEFAPDVVAINNDWWNVASFLQRAPKGLPLVGYMPVDGANLDPAVLPRLGRLAAAVWYTDFGYREAVKAGFRGARKVIPHGIDTRRWAPVDRTLAREVLELPVPEDAFIVGNVNRNQPRKRLDVTVQFFADWVHTRKRRNAWLLIHCAKHDMGWDLMQLAKHYGIADRLILTGGQSMQDAVDQSRLRLIYSALDVQVTTTLGEGWGLTTMEGMACGIPQIVPDWSALGEWAMPAIKVPCATHLAHPGVNTIGALPERDSFIAALETTYRNRGFRAKLARESSAFVRQPQFTWNAIAQQIDEVLDAAVQRTARRSAVPCP